MALPKTRRSRGRARVRIEDVARAAQVSPQTVSRFFRTPALVSSDTRAAISAAVEATGYVPNLVAGSLASNRSRIIAIVVPTIANPTHSAPVEGLSAVVRAKGYQVLLGTTAYDRATESEVVRALLGRQVDGLVITGGAVEPETRLAIERADIPVVQI